STCVMTNTTSVAAYRGAGRPEAAYYLERMMDIIAAELEMNPEEVRRKNFIPPSAFPYATPTGQNYDTGEYDTALTEALKQRHRRLAQPRDGRHRHPERGAEGAGEGAAHRRLDAGGVVRRRRPAGRQVPGEGHAGEGAGPGRDRRDGVWRDAQARARARPGG